MSTEPISTEPIECEHPFIEYDFKLPNHNKELSKADGIIYDLKRYVDKMVKQKTITNERHFNTFEEIIEILDYVGRLSIPAFTIENDLERMYITKYNHAPVLAKKLWYDHYESIHHPYTILKQRCFKMINDIDIAYENKFKIHPPNWEI